jgi:hypothetical protein
VVHLLNNYITGQYYDNRKGLVKLADVSVSINERRTGAINRVYRVAAGVPVELPIQRDGKWAEVHIPPLGVNELLVFE